MNGKKKRIVVCAIGFVMVCLVIAMFLSGVQQAKASEDVNASAGDKADPSSASAIVSGDYLFVSCSPLSGWRFINPSWVTTSTGGGNASAGPGYGSMTLTAESFTLKVKGVAVPINPIGWEGPQNHWWAKGNGPLTYWIDPTAQKIIPVGESQSYTSYLDHQQKTNKVNSNWQYQPSGGSWQNGAQGSSTYNFSNSTPAQYTIKGTWNSESDTSSLWNVGVEKVQYKFANTSDTFKDVPNPLVVCKDTPITFKVFKAPETAPDWPPSKPVWTDNTSGYQQEVYETFDVNFYEASSSPTDYKTVEVECGNTITVNAVVVDLHNLPIDAARTSEPQENLYPVKDDEHFEVGGTFEYALNMEYDASTDWPTPTNLFYEFWDLDWIDEVLETGSGSGFSRALAAGDKDDCRVRYFGDCNLTGSSGGSNSHWKDTPDFVVKDITTRSFEVEYSDLIPAATISAATIQSKLTTASNLCLKKDSADDWRACVTFTASSIQQFTSGPDRPDPCSSTDSSEYNKHFNATDITFLNTFIGAGGRGGPLGVIIEWDTSSWLQYALAHEIGHFFWLWHSGHVSPQIMHGLTLYPGVDDELLKSDVDNYE